eukprot:44817_1
MADKLLAKYPDRIPVICERIPNSGVRYYEKIKYLCPKDLTIGQFTYSMRKIAKVLPEESVFLWINQTLPSTSSTLVDAYQMHKDEDGFLYIKIGRQRIN